MNLEVESMKPMERRDVVLLSTADWDNPFWTNKQHVAVELARRGHRVLYVDSIGLRMPSATAQDLGRIWRRLKKGLKAPRNVRESLWVWSPLVVPLQRYRPVRLLNRVLLAAGLRFWMWRLGVTPDVMWTYNPMTLEFFSKDRFACTVYHCVDEIKAQPGMPVAQIEAADTALVRASDLVFVTAHYLLESRKAFNQNTYYFSNVADFDHFSKARDESTVVPADIAALRKPVIGFVGAISGYKVDFDLIGKMASKHPEWSIALIGKVGEGDPYTDVRGLQAYPNVHLLGARDYEKLPSCMKGFDVATLPCMLNEYTRSMFPMKFFEYLSAGLPVVSTALHALKNHADVAYIAADPDDFILGVEAALRGEAPLLARRLELALEQTYERRTTRMLDLLPRIAGGEKALNGGAVQ